jgi:hypothetical protein
MAVEVRHRRDNLTMHAALAGLAFTIAWPLCAYLALFAWPWGPLLGALAGLAMAVRRRTRGFGIGVVAGFAVAMPVLFAVFNTIVNDIGPAD